MTLLFRTGTRAALLLCMLLVCSSAFAATKQWLNTSNDGLWTTASNWSPSGVPGPGDDVQIGTSQTAFNCTLNVTTTVNSVTITDPYITSPQLIITGGAQLTLNAASSTASGTTIDMNGQILGAGNLTLGGPFVFRGGSIAGTGTLTILSTGSLTFNGSASSMALDRATTSDGTITHSSTSGSVYLGDVLTNTGLINITADLDMYDAGGGSIENSSTGTIRKSSGAGSAGFYVNVDNNAGGTIESLSGTLVLRNGTSASGSAFTTTNTPSQSTLQFAAGTTYNIVSGTAFNGTGVVQILGTLNVIAPADVTIANILLDSGGTISGTGVVRVGSAMTWNGGTMNGGGTTVVGLSTSLTLAGTNNYLYLDNRNLQIGGTANYTAPSYGFYLYNGAILNVLSGGTFNIQTDNDIHPGGTASSIVNAGTFGKTSGTGDTTINIPLTSSGAFNVLSGTIGLYNATTFNGGSISTGTTSSLDIRANTTTFSAATTIGGTGGFDLDGGDVKVNSGVTQTIPRLSMLSSSSSLIGPGNVILTGTSTFSSGTFGTQADPGGTVTIPSGSTLNLTSAVGYKYFDTIAFTNDGTVNAMDATYGIYLLNGATFTNAGTFDASVDGNIYRSGAAPALINSGLWTKSGGAGNYGINVPFTTTGTVDLQSGTLILGNGGTLDGSFLSAAGTSILVNSVVTVNPTVDFDAANGSFDIPASGNVTIPSGNVTLRNVKLTGGTIGGAGTLTLTGAPQWTSGSMGDFNAQGGTTIVDGGVTFTLTGASYMYVAYGRTLQNLGTIVYSPTTYYLYLQNNVTLDNDGTFTYQTDVGIFGTGTVSIDNSGTITKTTGTGTAAIDVVLHNRGTIVSQSGTLELGGATATNAHVGGTFTATAPGAIAFGGGVHTLDAASSLGGTGVIGVNGGASVTVDSPYTAAGFKINGATLTLNTNGSVSTLEMLNAATLGGTGTLTVTSTGTWSGGTMQGTGTTIVDSAATLNITCATSYAYLTKRTLTNNGTIVYGGNPYYLTVNDGATIHNAGTLNITNDSQIYSSYTDVTLNNSGTLTKTGGTGISSIQVVVNNTGSVTSTAGRLALTKGGTHTGTFTATSPGVIGFGGSGTNDFSGAGSIGGTGQVVFDGFQVANIGVPFTPASTHISSGTANFNAAASTATLALHGGVLGGTATFTVTGSATWAGGTMSGTGTTVINSGVTMTLNGASTYSYLDGRTLTNNGAIVYSATALYFNFANGGTLDNNGSFTITSDLLIYSSALADTFNNAGTFVKNAGSATTSFTPTFNNSGSVTVTSGGVQFNRGGTHTGAFTATAPGLIAFGGGTHNVGAPSSLTGTGTFSMVGGDAIVAGSYNPATLLISGGTLTLNSSGTAANFTQSHGTLSGSGTFTITGAATWSGGTMSGTGATVINAGVTMAMTASTSYNILDDRTLTNNGTINDTASPYYLLLQNGATLNNAGAFTINDSTIYHSAATDLFVNTGTFTKSTGTGTATIHPPFNNNGTVTVSSGRLALAGNGTSTGTFNASAQLELGNGTRTFSGPGALAVTGQLFVTAGTTTVNGPWSLASLKLTNGTLNLNTNGNIAALDFQYGVLGGTGTVNVTASATWAGGTMNGSGTTLINAAVTAPFTGTTSYMFVDGRTLTNNGTIQYNGGPYYLQFQNGATLNNTGSFLIGNDLIIYSTHTTDTLNNSGTFSKTAGSGDSAVYPTLVNTGSVFSTSGELTFHRGGTQTGSFTATSPGKIDFAGATTIAASSSLSGSGTYRFTSGVVEVNGPYASAIELAGGTANLNVNGTIPSLVMTFGNLGGNATLTIANTLTWTSGTMNGSGTTLLASGATGSIPNNGGYAYLDTRTFENDGTLTYGGGLYYLNVNNAQFLNDGTLDLNGDTIFYSSGSSAMTNNGTITKSAGSGTLSYYLPTTNAGSFRAMAGTLHLLNSYTQTAGLTEVGSGATLQGNLAINGGSLTGSGTVQGNVANAAIVAPGTSPGALAITGSYTQTAAGALNIELGGTTAGTQYDQLNVAGVANLAGTLNVSTVNGFTPSTGDVFQILGFGSRDGDFATKNGLALGGGSNLIATYGANNLQLSTNTVAADVFVAQTVTPSPSVFTGQNFTYNVTVTNGGASSASSVTLTGTLPSNVTLVSRTPSQGTCSGNPAITCNLGALANGASATIAITVTAGSPGPASFTASVTASEFDPDSADNSATATATVSPKADLSVTISDSPDPVAGNGTITYAVNVANAGPSAATSLSFNISLSGGGTITGITATGWSCGGDTTSRTCTMASMASGASSSITVTATAPNAAATITANASIGSTVFDSNTADNTASTTTSTNVCSPPTISAPSSVDPNSTGHQASTPPLGGATYAWTITGGTITSGQDTNAIIFSAGAGGEITLTVEVTAGACTESSTVTIAIPQPEADVSISKSGPATVAPGETFAYTLSVSNSGPANASDIVVVDTLPAGLTHVSTSATGWNCSQGGDTVSCTSGTLFAGSTRTITIDVKAPDAPATITNTASVSSSTPDNDTSNNDGSATTVVESSAPVCPTSGPSLNQPADGASNVASPVTFSWNAATNATSYDLFVASGNASPSLAGTTSGTAVTVAMPAGPASWYVVARAAGCDGVPSVTRTLTVASATNCNLNPAAQLIAPAGGSTNDSPVTFQWSAANGAISYTLWLSLGGQPFQDFGATTATSLTTNVPPASVEWYVEAHFAGCPSTSSAHATFTVPQPAPCQNAAPRLLAPANNTTTTTATIAFSWSPAENADGYRLWIQLAGEAAQVAGETTDTTLTDTIPAGTMTWWVEALFEGCASLTTEKFNLTVPRSQQCNTSAAELTSPANGFNTSTASVTFSWNPVPRAVKYELWLSLNSGTPLLLATTTSTSVTREVAEGELTWFVRTIFDGCDPTDSASSTFRYAAAAACEGNDRPVLLAPSEGEQLASAVDFAWEDVGAASYELWIAKGNADPAKVLTSNTNEAKDVELPNGAHRWFVRAIFGNGCPDAESAESRMVIVPQVAACSPLDAPVIAAPGQISHRARAFVQWSFVPGATTYVLQLSSHPDFSTSETETLNLGEQRSYPFVFENSSPVPVARYARVRAVDERCQPAGIGAYSPSAVIYILPSVTSDVSTLAGATDAVTYTLPLGGELAGLRFTATPAQPWLSVTPSSGVVPPGGVHLTVVAQTAGLPAGTSIGGVTITTTDATSSGVRASASSSTTAPVSISIVSPVSSTPKNTPPPDALLIPAVAHANGVNSHFQSDVRVSNTSPQVMKYQLTFTPSGQTGISKGQQTTFSVEPGQTVALDDILKTWFGSGDTQVFGALEVRPLTTSSKQTTATVSGLQNLLTFASSRTYNVTANGTFGQYVPAIPFSSFVDAASKSILQLPQIAQSAQYRTNLGFVEGSGQPATLLVTVYGQSGKLTEFPVELTGGQHLQMNSVLASKGIDSLDDGRIEVRVTGGNGKVTAYASVLDSKTNDPLLVAPINVTGDGGRKWVVPGVADLHQGFAEWRSDMRIFNAGTEAVETTLTYYSQSGGEPKVRTLTIDAGEVKQLDSTLNTVFGVSNDGGAVHISTPKAAKLIATARTYNQTSNGTFGQFIPAVTPNEAAAKGTRPLQILQVEESERYRSNIGLAEVTGKPVKVEVTIVRPESKNAAIVEVDLKANEFRQLNRLLESAGLAGTYNARVTVRAISGEGRVAAYASVVDMKTQDPTYIPAQ